MSGDMKDRPHRSARGSALILVLLIMLALSAIGLVALRSISRSIQQSGMYRVRTTASVFSDAVSQFMTKRLGDKASSMMGAMDRMQQMDMETLGTSMQKRRQLVSGGSPLVLRQRPGQQTNFDQVLNTRSGDESGLFTNGTKPSFEGAEPSSGFDVIIRDPLGGIPVPGYSDRYCFKKVTIATRADIGDFSQSWDKPRQVGLGRTVVEGLVGPVECGN
jgi:hypothetical protein